MQRILVTGGAGFVGSHTVELLLNEGKEVMVLDNLSSGKLSNLPLNHPDLQFIEGDILEYPLVKELIETCDGVLHLAAIASVEQTFKEPIYTFQVNVQGLLHVLCAIRDLQKPIRLVYASSAAVYGNQINQTCREDQDIHLSSLSSPYALQKKHGEDYACFFQRTFRINSLGLRYFNIFGDRQDPNSPYAGVISKFVERTKDNHPVTIFGDGLQSRDFIHVNDIARANLNALNTSYNGFLNIATGNQHTLLDLIDSLSRLTHKKIPVEFLHERTGDIKHSSAEVTAAKKEIGFIANTSLEEGLKSLINQDLSTIKN